MGGPLPGGRLLMVDLASSTLVKGTDDVSCLGLPEQIPEASRLQQQTFLFSQRGGGWGEAAGGPRSRCQQVWFLLRPLFLACRWASPPWVLTWSSLGRAHTSGLISSSPKDAPPIGLGPTHVSSFYLNYLIKGPISRSF